MKYLKWDKKKVVEEINALSHRLRRCPVKRDDERLYQIARRYFGSWNNSLKTVGFNIKVKQITRLPDIEKNEFYYFLGLIITDGHIAITKKKSYQIKMYTSYEEEKEMIIKLIYKLFNYNASIRARETGFSNRLNYEIYISSKNLCEFITNYVGIMSGEKSTKVRIPNLLFKSNKHKIGSFLRGVIDGDGTITKSASLKIVSGSKEFLLGIKRLLTKLQIKSGRICQERENLYNLWICGKDNLNKLNRVLYQNYNDFCYERKKKIWKQYI